MRCLYVLTLRNERVCSGVLLPTRAHRVSKVEDSCLSRAALRARHGTNWPLNSSRVAKEKKIGKKIWNKVSGIYVMTKPVDETCL